MLNSPDLRDIERDKYERVFAHESYSDFSPGERLVEHIFDIDPIASKLHSKECDVFDFGCGTGKAAVGFIERGFEVLAVDHTDAGLTDDAKKHLIARDRPTASCFVKACLWDLGGVRTYDRGALNIGFCADVMEHIPTEYVMLTLHEIMRTCHFAIFQIATKPDKLGALIGETLHLTVRPFTWWRDRLDEVAHVIDARDLMHAGLYQVYSDSYFAEEIIE